MSGANEEIGSRPVVLGDESNQRAEALRFVTADVCIDVMREVRAE